MESCGIYLSEGKGATRFYVRETIVCGNSWEVPVTKTTSQFAFRIACSVGFVLGISALDAIGAEDSALTTDAIRAAVAKSLPLLEKGARGSMEKRKQCFTCHNQGMPIMALTAARDRGFVIDEENLRQQAKFTADFLERNRTNYLAGEGQGGQALTAGGPCALGARKWRLEIGRNDCRGS